MRLASLALLLLLTGNAFAQQSSQYRGVAATELAVRKLATTKRVLVIAAHPDDEDNQLLSWLSLHEGADVAYLSLTRGEGGQNSIGPEYGTALGILRTGELLADREEDGAQQFFTRAFDFGYTKTSTEALQVWSRDSILADVLTHVRRFKPDVIIAIFQGTPADGHGQHQVSGLLAREAYARSPNVKKLIQATGYGQARPTQVFPAGRIDPLVGYSYAQLAALGRSSHRSQDMGTPLTPGPRTASIRVLESRVPVRDSSLWSGIDTTLQSARYDSLLAARDFIGVIRFLQQNPRGADELPVAADALLQQKSIVLDATSSIERIVPGATFEVRFSVWNSGTNAIEAMASPLLPAGWSSARIDSNSTHVTPDKLVEFRYRITASPNATLSVPYDSVVRAQFRLGVDGVNVEKLLKTTRRIVDPRQGELRRALAVVPPFSLRSEPSTSVLRGSAPAQISVVVQSNGPRGTLVVKPKLPVGWRSGPVAATCDIPANGSARVVFSITTPPNIAVGKYDVEVSASDTAGHVFSLTQHSIDYPHVINSVYFESAKTRFSVVDARIARGLRVGYIVGTDAAIPTVLEQLGMTVEVLDAEAVTRTDLKRFDAVVIGSRAFEVRPDVIANNGRLLDYARNGGNLVTMYQQYEFVRGNFAPYPMQLASPHDRITDENASVTILDTTALAIRGPNRISAKDFEGWVQERSLYMPHTWSTEYQPLLEMHDPGESPQRGALLVAPLGKGTYTYTGIAFFREIPAGVPGAIRLFINLLSMGIKDATF